MGKHKNERTLGIWKLDENAELTIPLLASRRTLSNVRIIVDGKLTLTTAGVTPRPGGLANIIANAQIIASGYDTSVQEGFSSETRIDIPGALLAWSGNTTAGIVAGAIGRNNRLNILAPHTPIIVDGDVWKEPNITSLPEQDVRCILEIPQYVSGGFSPADFRVNGAYFNFYNLQLRFGSIADLGLQGTTVPVGSFSGATVTVIVEEYELDDSLDLPGNPDQPQAYQRATVQEYAVEADNNAFRQPLNLAGNMLALAFIGYDEDNKPSDTILERLRIQRSNNNTLDVPAVAIRDSNNKAYKHFRNDDGTGTIVSGFKGSGMHYVCPAQSTDDLLLSRAQFFGNADGTAQWVAGIKKPAGGNGKLQLARIEAVMGPALSILTRAKKDLTANQRAGAQRIIDRMNERVAITYAAAKSANFNG